MSYSQKNFLNQPFYSPAKFENDQKDLMISQLKAENFELKQNDRDYQELATHLKSLEHRYNMLHEEKMRNEVEYRNRSDQTLKTIANLRNEIDNLKSQLTEKHIENQEMKAENLAFKEITEHRSQENQRVKNDMGLLQENNRKLYEEKLRLETELQAAKDERKRLLHDRELLNNTYEDVLDKLNEKEKQFSQLQTEFDNLEKQALIYKADVENINNEVKSKSENLKYTRMQYQEAQNYISQLQNDLEELHKQKEKFKQESLIYQKNYQQEADTCMELNAQVIQLDQTVKHQEKTIIDQRNEIERLKSMHMECLETTEELSHELDQAKRINDQLEHQHRDVMEELDKLSLTEEQAAMARASKYKELKTKLIMGTKQLQQFQSPFKRFSTNKKPQLKQYDF
ncbi:unnamed protein product [Paramecium primaurelia]|uniref:Uncharacterized protein n=2 Tax=Paramecium TaxID=5884 RepID=A0A8S1W1H6_9CILI|nr:unnamed protein product [Paramecium primaurelia]CAD8184208.1 unnamed protein product [Paramecium pentaurelia]